MRAIPNENTITVLDYLKVMTAPWHREPEFQRRGRSLEFPLPTPQLASIRNQLLRFDALLRESGFERKPLFFEGDPRAFRWLTYLEEVKVIPIYDEAVALVQEKPLVREEEVSNILQFITIPGSNYGVDDPEEHGFGYHFHYGKVRSNKLNRFNVVLTFDKRNEKPNNSHDPLFSEEHGSGRYQHIDISTVGKNVRHPVYKICEGEMSSIGRDQFKIPAKKAQLFY